MTWKGLANNVELCINYSSKHYGSPCTLLVHPHRPLSAPAPAPKSFKKFPQIVTYTFVGLDELPGFDTHILPEMAQNLPRFAHT